MITDRTVLVTGGAGFIGGHIAARLVADNDVRVLDNVSTGEIDRVPDEVEFVQGDLRDGSALDWATDGVDVIFHQAGLVSVDESIEEPVRSHRTNATATVELLERARQEDARIVVASSCAIYGDPEHTPIAEDAPKRPKSPYAIDKLAIDQYTRTFADLYDLDAVPLRYFNVYGPGQTGGEYSGVITAFLEQARTGGPITVHGDGEQTRDFVHVSDVVDANLAAATTDHTGQAYNIGTGTSTSIRELAELVRDVIGSRSEIVHRDGRQGDVRHSEADLARARELLDYKPSVSLEDGLADLVAGRR
ncbi:NAD-dependent epimerase/dehydratase family protein [Natranaeroarchaeum aerophilus]|uniref:NAD-dependent epimerase/dehydratase family protein n=2 Tax=Natranaeroarchaeum aerophilus TaxID=2917711 RepID=A0AAE3K647_9EURY|nr:NAD-dependent epimerase/dehydratase family protein [Natranaeroarchaeum aerophilus]MCL9814030.1 NAD-dependent epimerase/dehydratase family protein [Natranaeroarchaeum aerophilus]